MIRRTLPDLIPWALLLAISTAAFAALRWNPGLDVATTLKSPAGHFHIVTVTAAMCAVISAATAIVVVRVANVRLLWLALAFFAPAALMTLHGLTTPGFVVGARWASAAALGSCSGRCSSRPALSSGRGVRHA